jgi:dephospho-CoA kinase
MTVVALTGGVGAGKTTVSSVLESCGAIVIDADVLARAAVTPGTEALQRIAQRFGSAVLESDGSLNRAALGHIVFSDESARLDLNAIVHPEVKKLYDRAVTDATQGHPEGVVVYAVPLLAEARDASEFDAVVVVHAPAEIRQGRLVDHRGLTAEEARQRVEAQVSDENRLALADVVLDASGTLESTEDAARELYDELARLWPDRLSELPKRFPRVDS